MFKNYILIKKAFLPCQANAYKTKKCNLLLCIP